MWRPSANALLTIVPMFVVGTVGGFLSWQYQSGLRHERDRVVHTWEVIDTMDQLLAAATGAETGQRGFIITADPAFLAPFEEAEAALPRLFDRARTLLHDNPAQTVRLESLRDLIEREMTELAQGVALRRGQGYDAARERVTHASGKQLLDAARATTAGIVAAERTLLQQRTADVHAREHWVVAVGLATALLSLSTRGVVQAWVRTRATSRP